MKEDLEKVKSLVRDLREDKESPRSPRQTLGGDALAACALDKCRATLVGWQGEYFSNRHEASACVKDFAGNHWWIHTHIEDVPPEESKEACGNLDKATAARLSRPSRPLG